MKIAQAVHSNGGDHRQGCIVPDHGGVGKQLGLEEEVKLFSPDQEGDAAHGGNP